MTCAAAPRLGRKLPRRPGQLSDHHQSNRANPQGAGQTGKAGSSVPLQPDVRALLSCVFTTASHFSHGDRFCAFSLSWRLERLSTDAPLKLSLDRLFRTQHLTLFSLFLANRTCIFSTLATAPENPLVVRFRDPSKERRCVLSIQREPPSCFPLRFIRLKSNTNFF